MKYCLDVDVDGLIRLEIVKDGFIDFGKNFCYRWENLDGIEIKLSSLYRLNTFVSPRTPSYPLKKS